MRTGTEERLAAWVTFLQAHAVLVRALDRELEEEVGIPLTSYEVLLHLALAPEGRMRMNDLAGSLLLSKSGVTRLIDRMAHAGLVERAPSPEDRRVVWAAITARGRRAFAEAAPVHLRGIEARFAAHLSAPELRSLRTMLRKVLEANGFGACRSPADFQRVTGRRRAPASA